MRLGGSAHFCYGVQHRNMQPVVQRLTSLSRGQGYPPAAWVYLGRRQSKARLLHEAVHIDAAHIQLVLQALKVQLEALGQLPVQLARSLLAGSTLSGQIGKARQAELRS